MEVGYSIYSEFDIEQHKKKYVNYLEVLIEQDGRIVYAVPWLPPHLPTMFAVSVLSPVM